MSNAEIGCLKSHCNVLLQTPYEVTIILEDDFELCNDFDSKLQQCFSELPADFSALWLGGRVVGEVENYSANLYKIKAITGTYGYIVHSNFIPALLKQLAKENKTADWAMCAAFDGKVFKTKENLVLHKAGHSVIKGQYVDYKDLRK